MLAEGETVVQVVQENSTSAVFSIAMVVVYDECVISEVSVLPSRILQVILHLCCSLGCMGPALAPASPVSNWGFPLKETSVIATAKP